MTPLYMPEPKKVETYKAPEQKTDESEQFTSIGECDKQKCNEKPPPIGWPNVSFGD
jgi:hypothetical protein